MLTATKPKNATPSSNRQWVADLIGEVAESDLLTKFVESLAEKLNPPVKPVLVDIRGATAMTGKSRADIYRGMAANTFPKQVDDGTGAARWRVKDIEMWALKLKAKK